jgi:uncharacterized protein (TIGR02466 family)
MDISGFMMLSIPTHPNQHNIFQTPIWGFVLNNEEYQSIDYTQYIVDMAETTPSVTKSNVGGWQSSDDLHTHGIFREFSGFLLRTAKTLLEPYTQNKLEIQSMWANINTQYNFNWQHTHEGVLSGVFYLKVPKDSGRLIMVNPLIRSFNSPIKQSNFPIVPEHLACIMFPSWLEHYVEPNLTEETRISLSFNIGEVL